MPTYEYLCDECGAFAAMAPMAAFAQPTACPGCGASAARNLVTAPALGGQAEAAPAAPGTRRHAAACACCAPRRPLRAEAVRT